MPAKRHRCASLRRIRLLHRDAVRQIEFGATRVLRTFHVASLQRVPRCQILSSSAARVGSLSPLADSAAKTPQCLLRIVPALFFSDLRVDEARHCVRLGS
jgi:hypothetical protein